MTRRMPVIAGRVHQALSSSNGSHGSVGAEDDDAGKAIDQTEPGARVFLPEATHAHGFKIKTRFHAR